jgi:hypothetical protein
MNLGVVMKIVNIKVMPDGMIFENKFPQISLSKKFSTLI